MNSHEDEEEPTAVEANIENEVNQYTHRLSQLPFRDMVVVGPKGQTCGEEEIGYSQVQDESVGEGFQILILEENDENEDVSKQAEDHHSGEKQGSKCRSKFNGICLVAFVTFVVIVIDL